MLEKFLIDIMIFDILLSCMNNKGLEFFDLGVGREKLKVNSSLSHIVAEQFTKKITVDHFLELVLLLFGNFTRITD